MKIFFLSVLFSISVFYSAAQSYDSLDINNIHAGFNAAGDLFYNINTGNGHITTPANKILYSIGNLWIGGLVGNNQLHIAAQTYRQNGTDFWPGTLDTTNITCDTATSHFYNKVWKLNCADIDSFFDYTQSVGPTNYSVPNDIQTWPGNGNFNIGMPFYLAPFVDVDGDHLYNWSAGDYPIVRGNQSLFYVYNDHLINQTHTETGGLPLGIEIHAMPYAFNYSWDNALMNTIFIHYTIINRSTVGFSGYRIGFWSDFDLSSVSTKVGSDSLLGAYYYYGSDNAAGVVFLNTPMSGCIAYDNSFSVTGNPTAAQQYYNYLQQKWTNGNQLTVGGNGYGGTAQTNWMFNGDPATGTGWNDNSNNSYRIVGSTNDSIVNPGMTYTFDVALVFANDTTSSFSSVTLLKQYMQHVKSFYATQSQICTPGITSVDEINSANNISIFPNPATSQITIHTSEKIPQPYFIFNVEGKLMQTGMTNGNETILDIAQFSEGMYFLRIGKEENIQTIKFVKTTE